MFHERYFHRLSIPLCSGIKRDVTHGRRARNFSQQVIHVVARDHHSLETGIRKSIAKLIARLCPPLHFELIIPRVSRRDAEGTFKAGDELVRAYRRIHKRVHYSCTRIRI